MLAKSSCSAVSAALRSGATSQRCWNTAYQQRRQPLHTSRPRQSSWPVSAPQEQEPADDVVKAGTADAPEGSHLAGGSGSQERRSTRLQQSAPIDRTDAGHSKARGKLEMPKSQPGKSISQLGDMKRQGKPVACLTAYDYPSALSLRHADIDICLVGDSMANVALGHSSTQSLTLEATIHHCQAVHRGLFSPLLSISPNIPGAPLLIADVPFGSFQTSAEEGVRSAVRLLKEGGVDGVKIEGGQEILPLVRRLTQFGIPVMGHLGLQPQRVSSSGGYRLQGRTADEASEILRDALALQEAGVFGIVLECIPNKIGELISQRLDVVTIGIGAGPMTDGQILVTNDMLGEITSPWHVVNGLEPPTASTNIASTAASFQRLPRLQAPAPQGPKFVRNFVAALEEGGGSSSGPASTHVGIGAMRMAAIEAYVAAVRQRSFPDPDREGYKMQSKELNEFRRRIAEDEGKAEHRGS